METETPTTQPSNLTATCHCGAVRVEVATVPAFINACNCGWCGKLGAWWGYYAPAEVHVTGTTSAYVRNDKAEPAAEGHFCPRCGTTTHWQRPAAFAAKHGGADMAGVNMRLFDREGLRGVQLLYPDGKNWDGIGQWGFVKEAEIL